jgi:hypothetical protein
MPETDRWLDDYGASHRNISHPPVYWLSVIVIIVGTVGLLWSLPVPDEFLDISPILNWGTAFLLSAVVYYFIISLALAFGMLPFVVCIVVFHLWLQYSVYDPLYASTGMVIAGLVGLYLGHYRSDGLRAVLKDVHLMMIAPVWLLSRLYRRLGIPH